MKSDNTETIKQLARDAKSHQWGSKERVDAINDLCSYADNQPWQEEFNRFAFNATGDEIVDYLLDKLKVQP